MGFLSRIPVLGMDAPEAPGHPLSHPGVHEIRALAGDGQANQRVMPEERHGANSAAGQLNCKRPGCTAPITGTYLQLCAGHEDEYLDLFLDTEASA